ncbi:serine hydrolase [Kitasatospora sp. NPDC059795]|uniref:serine hydrolase n=1 Tax=Kitasatospora sp. NPDC059795 TaxID=3346949 RepID=UPI00364A6CFD
MILEEAVGDHLPQFRDRRVADPLTLAERPAAREPTVLDLMRHTAGIPEGLLGRTALHARDAEAVDDGMTALAGPEFVAYLAALPLLTDPGTQWHPGRFSGAAAVRPARHDRHPLRRPRTGRGPLRRAVGARPPDRCAPAAARPSPTPASTPAAPG